MPATPSEVADALDELARASHHLRRLLPRMTIEQVMLIGDCSPWGEEAENMLIQMDTWAVVAATEVRGELREYLREVGT